MYAEGETELRDIIIQNLETSGFLNKIKAELRAGVFIAFEEEGSLRTKNPLFNKKFDEFIDTSNGKLAVSLVREFLEYFNLNFTLSVFDPETSNSDPCLNRTDLCDKLNLNSSELNGPVISALLKTDQGTSKQPSNGANTFAQSSISNSLNSKKSLETISEDISPKENSKANDSKTAEHSTTFDVGNNSTIAKSINEDRNQKPLDAVSKKSGFDMIDKLRNEHQSLEVNKDESVTVDIFGTNKSNTDIFKANPSEDIDTFFDEPLPPQKTSYFGELSPSKPVENKSSSKFLPDINTTKSNNWSFSKDPPDALSNLDSKTSEEKEIVDGTEKNTDAESNEASSDRQLNSEESIEEEIEEEISGIEDLLNSSLSMADDATTDQSASQISVVDGIDHIEPVTN